MTERRLRFAGRAAVVVWMGVIFFLSSQPTPPDLTGGHPELEDVLGHLLAYAVLAVLLGVALVATPGVTHPLRWALLLAALYGLSDEFHQSFVPNRHPDPFDVATDLVGAGLGLLMLRSRLQGRRARPPGPDESGHAQRA